MENLTRGKLAIRAGVNSETLRYYEQRGLIDTPGRSSSGYRLYPLETIDRIKFIKNAQQLGFSLKEIRELLAMRIREGQSCKGVHEQAQIKMDEISKKIETLTHMKQSLEKLASLCTRNKPTGECPIIEFMSNKEAL